MPATHLSNPRLWTNDTVTIPDPPRWMERTPDVAQQLYQAEAFRLPPKAGRGPTPEPYSRAWFEQIAKYRYSRPGRWIPRVLEFGRHSGETLLGLGGGLGCDWLQYARHGTHVVACSQSREHLDLIERHFRLCEGEASFVHAPPHALPFDSASVDVVCIQGVLHQTDRPQAVIDDIYRVLRPGGKVIAMLPAYFDAAYWQDALMPWLRWFRRPRTPHGMTARRLKQDFARFVDHRVKKRHLRRSQLPQVWRLFPLPLLERMIGQFLVLKAFKPVSAALAAQIAA